MEDFGLIDSHARDDPELQKLDGIFGGWSARVAVRASSEFILLKRNLKPPSETTTAP
jgi:hypothetical protein